MGKPWTRWEDWAMLLVGAATTVSPLAVAGTTRTAVVWAVLGTVVTLLSLFSLAMPAWTFPSEWARLVLGALLFIAPWVMSYADYLDASWLSWVAGFLVFVLSVVGLPSAAANFRKPTPER